MTTYAAQIILHPAASQTLNVLATTLGRDKIYRAIQYFARFFAWYLVTHGHAVEGAKWNALKNHLASGRKLVVLSLQKEVMRLLKPLEHLQAALKASQLSSPHLGEQLTTIGRQVAYAGYLTYDAIVWANSIRFLLLTPDKATKVTKASYRFWLAGILFSIVNGLLKTGRIAHDIKRTQSGFSREKISTENEMHARRLGLESDRSTVRHQLVIDFLDVWIPATNLGFANLNDGVLGIFGLITSLMALRTQWRAVNKI